MSSHTRWPLVGREQELSIIEDAVADVGSGLVIAGTAGVGKTRLAREALDMARERGQEVEWLAATSASASIPFGVFAGYLPRDVDKASQFGLFHSVTSALIAKGGDGRLLLGIDDAHHLDDASAAVVHQLTVSDEVAVIATVRTGEAVPGPITSLWKEGLAARLDLQPLAEAEIADLVARAVGGWVEGRTLRRLWEASEGNALFLHELVTGGIEAGSLREDGGVWLWDGPLAISRLHELIESRLAHLPAEERAALDRLAVAEPLRIDLFERVVSPAVLAALDERELVQLEPAADGDQVRVSHPLYADTIRSGLTPLRLRSLHKELAGAISVGEGVDDLRVVVWCLDAEHPLPPDLLLATARRAADAYDHHLAERLARVAEAAGGGAAAARALATALNWQGRHTEAEATFARLALSELSPPEVVSVARSRAANLFYGLGRTEEALDVLTDAEAELDRREPDSGRTDSGGHGSERARLVGMRSNVLVSLGRMSELTHLTEPVLADGSLEGRTQLEILAPTALAWACQGKGDRVVADETQLVELERRWGGQVPRAAGWLLAARYRAKLLTGRLDDAETIVRRRYDEGALTGSPELLSGSAAALGELALLRGAPTTAVGWLSEAASGFRRQDPNGLLPWVRCMLIRAEALRGRHQPATGIFDDLGPSSNDEGMFEYERDRARAWIAAASGEVTAAQRAAISAAGVAGDNGQLAHKMLALHDAVRFGARASTAEELAVLAGGLDGVLAAAIELHALAAIEGSGTAYSRAADAFTAVGCPLYAAEAAMAAASAYRREGHGGPAWSERSRIDGLRDALEDAQSPALVAGEEDPLTPREREVASLAAQGLSNRDIADRLIVSLRTVENHLHQVYSKLDVGGRSELTTVLGGSQGR